MEGELKRSQQAGTHGHFRCEEEDVRAAVLSGAVLHDGQRLCRNDTPPSHVWSKSTCQTGDWWLLTVMWTFPSTKLNWVLLALPSNRGRFLLFRLAFFIETVTFPFRSCPAGFPYESCDQSGSKSAHKQPNCTGSVRLRGTPLTAQPYHDPQSHIVHQGSVGHDRTEGNNWRWWLGVRCQFHRLIGHHVYDNLRKQEG